VSLEARTGDLLPPLAVLLQRLQPPLDDDRGELDKRHQRVDLAGAQPRVTHDSPRVLLDAQGLIVDLPAPTWLDQRRGGVQLERLQVGVVEVVVGRGRYGLQVGWRDPLGEC
jgi:hypothetical protein